MNRENQQFNEFSLEQFLEQLTTVNVQSIEQELEGRLEQQLNDYGKLCYDKSQVDNPQNLGQAIADVVWEQFINQIGVNAGEEFIRKNRGLKLDLREDAHIQTTENFVKGKVATHNDKIDYQHRYDTWMSKFQIDENGNIVTHTTRIGTQESTLSSGAREAFDLNRPTGSASKGTDMDHTISAGEIIRDPAANAHLSEQEQINFANSEKT